MELALLHLLFNGMTERDGKGYLSELCLGFLNRHEHVHIGSVQPYNVIVKSILAVTVDRKL